MSWHEIMENDKKYGHTFAFTVEDFLCSMRWTFWWKHIWGFKVNSWMHHK